MKPKLADIDIRTDLRLGDIGCIIQMHATLYGSEYGYGIQFETYVALGLHEFYAAYDTGRDRVWICEHGDRMVGSMLLMHRGSDTAQLRYFLIRPEYRGIGLGKLPDGPLDAVPAGARLPVRVPLDGRRASRGHGALSAIRLHAH